MIPDKLVEFLTGPVVLLVGTASTALRPSGAYAFGLTADAEKDVITFFLPDVEGEDVLRDLRENGRVAVTASQGGSHETYQVKGRLIEARPVDDGEKAFQDAYREKAIAHYTPLGVPEGYFGSMVYDPSTAVSFRLEEVFDQTPGPAAGDKIEFIPNP